MRLARRGLPATARHAEILPRVYLVADTQEPFFLANAIRWANALRNAGAEVVMTERDGRHGRAFWKQELPRMLAWALRR